MNTNVTKDELLAAPIALASGIEAVFPRMTIAELVELQRAANRVARKAGHSTATEIRVRDKDAVLDHTPHGYRKHTTGEYVPNSYRDNFGWKNTYYQHAETLVSLSTDTIRESVLTARQQRAA